MQTHFSQQATYIIISSNFISFSLTSRDLPLHILDKKFYSPFMEHIYAYYAISSIINLHIYIAIFRL